jgi:hypothetical protein
VIGGTQVLVTQASLNDAVTVPYMEMQSMPPRFVPRSRVIQSAGTTASSGSISFDLTSSSMTLLSATRLFARRYQFSVGYNDGEDGWRLQGCFMTSLSLQGSVGGLISASLQFVSASAIESAIIARAFVRDQTPYGYWYSGNTDVKEWTFGVSQQTNAIYTNMDSVRPRYIRVGSTSMTLDVTTYEQVREHDDISVAGSTFTVTGHTGARGYTFGGTDDLGNYSHTFESAATMGFNSGGSSSTVLTIT